MSRYKLANDIDVPDDFVLPEGSVIRGQKLFKKHCAQCHTIRKDSRNPHGVLIGPSLYGVMGRTAAQNQRTGWMKQSTALEESNILWTDRNMMAFLKNPRAFAGGVINMNFKGLDSWKDRIDVIHYLKYAGHDGWMTQDGIPHTQKDWWKRNGGKTTSFWDHGGRDDGKDLKPWQHLWRAAKRKSSDLTGGVKEAVVSSLGFDVFSTASDEIWDVKPDSATTSRYDNVHKTMRPVEHVPDGVKTATKKQGFNWPPHEVIARGPVRVGSPLERQREEEYLALARATDFSSEGPVLPQEPAPHEAYLLGGHRSLSGLMVYRSDDGQGAPPPAPPKALREADGGLRSPGGLLVYDAP